MQNHLQLEVPQNLQIFGGWRQMILRDKSAAAKSTGVLNVNLINQAIAVAKIHGPETQDSRQRLLDINAA
jgi:hypothetical protein